MPSEWLEEEREIEMHSDEYTAGSSSHSSRADDTSGPDAVTGIGHVSASERLRCATACSWTAPNSRDSYQMKVGSSHNPERSQSSPVALVCDCCVTQKLTLWTEFAAYMRLFILFYLWHPVSLVKAHNFPKDTLNICNIARQPATSVTAKTS